MPYEMFTPAGDRACESMVKSIKKKILGKTRLTKEDIEKIYNEGLDKVEAKHPEVHDTEPRWHIAKEISKALEEAGYRFYINSWGDVEDN